MMAVVFPLRSAEYANMTSHFEDEETRKRRRTGVLEDGDNVAFSLMLMDAQRTIAAASLFDSAGVIRQLYDANTGAIVPTSPALSAAIVDKAGALGLTVENYLRDVVKYTFQPSNQEHAA